MVNVCAARYPEGVKTSGWIATGIGAVVLAGGGIWAATTLPARDEATEPETAYTGSYEPVETETPEPSVEPTEAVETPDVKPVPEETSAPEHTEAEAELIQVTRYGDLSNLDLSDGEILEAAQQVCIERDAGLHEDQMTVGFPEATEAQNIQFRINAVGSVCVAQD